MQDFHSMASELYESLKGRFVNFIKSRFAQLDDDDINDIYNDAFMAAYDNIQAGRVADDTHWGAYIMRIGYNQATTVVKKKSIFVNPQRPDDDDDEEQAERRWDNTISLADALGSEDDEQEKQQKIDTLLQELEKLKPPCATILIDYYFGEMSLTEIMEALGFTSMANLKVKKMRCMDSARKLLSVAFKQLAIEF